MMYGKLENDKLVKAPVFLVVNEQKVWNAPSEVYRSQGWYPVVYTNAPEVDDWYYAEPSWEVEEERIVQVWTVIEVPVPTDDDELTDEQAFIVLTGGEIT